MDRGDHPRPNDTDSTFVGQIPAEPPGLEVYASVR
jgi:hypothetical protein